MAKDQIVDEVRRIREKQAPKSHFDAEATRPAAKAQQLTPGRKAASVAGKQQRAGANFKPVRIRGERLSTTVLRERR